MTLQADGWHFFCRFRAPPLQEVANALGVVDVLTQPVEEKPAKTERSVTALQERLAKRAKAHQSGSAR